jgi:hypothetical protein
MSNPIEAHGVKGMKNVAWRKVFKTVEALIRWADKNDAQIYATRDIEAK